MFNIDEFIENNPDFKALNENQYIALYTYTGEEKKYLTKDKTLTNDPNGMMVRKKKDLIKAFAYIELIDKLKLKFEEYDAVRNSDSCNQAFKLKGDIDDRYDLIYFPETDEWYSTKDGMTNEERKISEYCIEIVNEFAFIPVHHVSHNTDLCNAIHDIQRILQSRTCHRLYPTTYPIKNGKVDK